MNRRACSRSSPRPTLSADTTWPCSFSTKKAEKLPSSIEPRTTSSPEPGPTYSNDAQSARSEKKYGTTSCSTSWPSMFSPAVLPWLKATSQCSSRIRSPRWTGLSYSQMSPAAKMPGTDVSSPELQRTPPLSPSSSPAERASMTSGITPTPTTTMSQSSSFPAFVITRDTRPSEPSKRSSSSPPCTSTPCSSSTPWKKRPTSSPNWRDRTTSPRIPIQHPPLLHHDRAADAVRRGQRRRPLAADVAAADQHRPLRLSGVRADRIGVRESPQVVDPLEVAAVHADPPHVGAGRHQRLVELDLVLGRQRRHPLGRVELHHAGAAQQLDRLLAPPLVGPEQRVLAGLLALEIALRQRRAVVGRVELAADQQDRSVGARV